MQQAAMPKLRSGLKLGALLLMSSCTFTACNTNKLVYPGSRMQLPDAACGYPMQNISIQANDGTRLKGWFFNRGANTPLVAIYGGNAMNVGNLAHIAASDPTRSYLLINYRGYGNSEGTPSEKALVADARHCIYHARSLMGNPGAPLYLLGFSLGSSVATQLATTERPAGLVLVCPFDSITSVACNAVPFFPRLLPMDKWKSTIYAPQVTCPVTIIKAQYDRVVPAASTDKLIRAFRSTTPTVRIYPADHNNIFSAAGITQDILNALPVTEQCRFDF